MYFWLERHGYWHCETFGKPAKVSVGCASPNPLIKLKDVQLVTD